LQKQLKDLDPEGTIQKFLLEGGPRPDLSGIINRKPKKKKNGTVIDRPKKKGPAAGAGAGAGGRSKKVERGPQMYDDYEEDEDDDGAGNSKENEDGDDDDDDDDAPPARGARRAAPTPSPRAAPTAAAAAANDEELYTTVLAELYESLDGALSNKARTALVEYLKNRIEGIADPKKREITVSKIAEKLGDLGYWVDYAGKL
jgi:hypothetical protein